jgi:hypothetical protein
MDGDLRERILSIMDQKDHWAWPSFTRPGLTKAQLTVHFRHEFLTYVRDFPVLLARVLGQGPPTEPGAPWHATSTKKRRVITPSESRTPSSSCR